MFFGFLILSLFLLLVYFLILISCPRTPFYPYEAHGAGHILWLGPQVIKCCDIFEESAGQLSTRCSMSSLWEFHHGHEGFWDVMFVVL